MKVRLKIGTTTPDAMVDYTDKLFKDELIIQNNMEHFIDTFEFSLLDVSGTLFTDDTFKNGHDVILEDFNDSNTRLYGGIIVQIIREPVGADIIFHFTAQDYTILLHKTTFVLQRTLITDKDLIAAAFSAANGGDGLDEIDSTTNIESGRQFDVMSFPGQTLADLMDIVSQATAFVWYVDFNKNLHYHRYAKETAAINFTDINANITATTVPYYDFNYNRSIGEFNAVEVRGQIRLSSDVNQEYRNTGSEKKFNLDINTGPGAIASNIYQPLTREPSYLAEIDTYLIDIYVNAESNLAEALDASETGIDVVDGSKYVATDVILIDDERILVNSVASNTLTVTRGHLSSTAATHADTAPIFIRQVVEVLNPDQDQFTNNANLDVIWDRLYLTVEFRTAPPNLATNSWRAIGRHGSPAIARARDQAAITRVNNRIFEHIMNEPLITHEEQALDIAKAFLRAQGPKEKITLSTTTDGLEICTLTHVNNAKLNIDQDYLVTSIQYRILGGEVLEYVVSLERSRAIFDLLGT